MPCETLRFVLGDQLNRSLSSIEGVDKTRDVIFMCEVWDETQYVKHHPKKIAFLFSAMRHFAKELQDEGLTVDYQTLDQTGDAQGSFIEALKAAIKRHSPQTVAVTFPGEYRVLKMLEDFQEECFQDEALPTIEIYHDTRFVSTREEFEVWADGKKQLRMEFFYREMRRKTGLLMDAEGKPEGGAWNYDSENRKRLPDDLSPPVIHKTPIDEITKEILEMVRDRFSDHFGALEPFHFAVTRQDALKVLDHFIDERLVNFGDYQDAMKQGEPWMFHSHISFYLNCGLLLPIEVCEAAEKAYKDGKAPLNAVEGFIRQVIGWREYIRGIYWLNMPDYAQSNALGAQRALPAFFWDENKTKMNCLHQCVKETRQNAYAHHIQRLMVLGNFALLAGLSPEEVNEWYLIVYADAYEWVEMPNVSGMILYADNGIVASKPYAASGAYINKMSDYCKNCSYSVTKKNGEKACPFNYLYWDFVARHEERFANNPRMAMIYRSYAKMTDEKKQAIQEDSARFFRAIENNEFV